MIDSRAPLLPRGVLSRVAASIPLVITIAAISLGSSWALGRAVRTIVAAAMSGKAYRPDGHHLSALLELLVTQPTVAAALVVNLAFAGLFATVLWLLLAGGVIGRLWRALPPSEVVAACVSQVPGMFVHTLWFLVLRGLLFIPLVSTPAALQGVALVVVAVPWIMTVAAHDLVRARWVVGVEKRWGPRATFAALKDVTRSPMHLVSSGALWAVALATSASILFVTLQKLHLPGTIWTLRALALIPIVLGVVRLALAVDRAAAEDTD